MKKIDNQKQQWVQEEVKGQLSDDALIPSDPMLEEVSGRGSMYVSLCSIENLN